ncbi:MAG TPA: DUF881 domain-containing protein [Candidatus Limnocylindrales bacterium]|nr:DUF881 domain-containing protein [Candidatus Limnocylindrales bacterium]
MTAIRARIRAIPSWQVTLAIALLVLGFLIAAQLAAEGPRVRYTTQESSSLIETALGLQAQQNALKAQILGLRNQVGQLEGQGSGSDALVRQLNDDLEQARIAAGLIALNGPGIVFKLEDAGTPDGGADARVSARDVRIVVEELWLAGAEAVSVNGERVTVSTAFLDIGGSVLANSAYLAPPYEISAIGPPGLYDRMAASPSFIGFVADRVQGQGIQLSVAQLDSVDIPAFAGTVNVRFGQPQGSPVPASSAGGFTP